MAEYTPGGMPVISEKIIKEVIARAQRREYKLNDFRKIIEIENPHLYRALDILISRQSESKFGPDFIFGVVTGVQFLYEALRKQSAANELEREINKK